MERKARVAVCILLIAWNPNGESETLPSDQPPASLALSLRRKRREEEEEEDCQRASHFLLQTICDIQYIYSTAEGMFEGIFRELNELLFRTFRFFCFHLNIYCPGFLL